MSLKLIIVHSHQNAMMSKGILWSVTAHHQLQCVNAKNSPHTFMHTSCHHFDNRIKKTTLHMNYALQFK